VERINEWGEPYSLAIRRDNYAVCRNCNEPYVAGAVTDRLVKLLERFAHLPIEVSVASDSELIAA
jgi:hypothetical protein